MKRRTAELLNGITDLRVDESGDLSLLTGFRTGGRAVIAVPQSRQALIETVNVLRKQGEKHFILGNGSNVLAMDDGYDGIVVLTREACAQIEPHPQRVRLGKRHDPSQGPRRHHVCRNEQHLLGRGQDWLPIERCVADSRPSGQRPAFQLGERRIHGLQPATPRVRPEHAFQRHVLVCGPVERKGVQDGIRKGDADAADRPVGCRRGQSARVCRGRRRARARCARDDPHGGRDVARLGYGV